MPPRRSPTPAPGAPRSTPSGATSAPPARSRSPRATRPSSSGAAAPAASPSRATTPAGTRRAGLWRGSGWATCGRAPSASRQRPGWTTSSSSAATGSWTPATRTSSGAGSAPTRSFGCPAGSSPRRPRSATGVARGVLSPPVTFQSAAYGAPVVYRVYTPAGYERLANLPVIYVTDGHEYADDRLGALRVVLDNLVARGEAEPAIVVFIDPRWNGQNRREAQYVQNPAFAAFVATELVPAIDAQYRTRRDRDARVILGTSLGGPVLGLPRRAASRRVRPPRDPVARLLGQRGLRLVRPHHLRARCRLWRELRRVHVHRDDPRHRGRRATHARRDDRQRPAAGVPRGPRGPLVGQLARPARRDARRAPARARRDRWRARARGSGDSASAPSPTPRPTSSRSRSRAHGCPPGSPARTRSGARCSRSRPPPEARPTPSACRRGRSPPASTPAPSPLARPARRGT